MNKGSPFTSANRQRDAQARDAMNKRAGEWGQANRRRKQANNDEVDYDKPRLGCMGRLSLMVKRSVQCAIVLCLFVVGYFWYTNDPSFSLNNPEFLPGMLTIAGYGAVLGLVEGLFEKR